MARPHPAYPTAGTWQEKEWQHQIIHEFFSSERSGEVATTPVTPPTTPSSSPIRKGEFDFRQLPLREALMPEG